MKALDLIMLIQEKCKSDDEIFITTRNGQGKVIRAFDPDINLTHVDADDEKGELTDIDDNRIPATKTFHIW